MLRSWTNRRHIIRILHDSDFLQCVRLLNILLFVPDVVGRWENHPKDSLPVPRKELGYVSKQPKQQQSGEMAILFACQSEWCIC